MTRYGAASRLCPRFGSTYYRGCRCGFCQGEASRKMNDYRDRRKAGAVDTVVPANKARSALLAALRRGYTHQQVIDMCSISQKTFSSLTSRREPTARKSTVDRIVTALEEPSLAAVQPGTLIPVKRSLQLVRSMSAQGFSRVHQRELLARHRKISAGFICSINSTPQIRRENADHIEWLAKQIGNRIGPSKEAATSARSLGFFPQIHYSVKGDLIVSSLSSDQQRYVTSVL